MTARRIGYDTLMPFRSKAQARLMWRRHPRIARRWVKESGSKHPIRSLPAKRTKRSKRRH